MHIHTKVAALLLAAAGLDAPVAAHDTWFAPRPATDRGGAVLALGTGNAFPHQEFPVARAHLQRSGCMGAGPSVTPLRWVADEPAALLVQSAPALPATGSFSCWAQLLPFEIEIDDALVAVYLDEIRALPRVRQRWAELRARGVRWNERYVKHARIELAGAAGPETASGVGTEAIDGLGLDVRLQAGPHPLRAGDTLRAQVLRDGQPLAGLPVELRSDLSPLGLWRHTDAEGRVELTLPLAARWVLRGVDLRPSADRADAWDSRFVTLAFEVLPRR
ncbi:MAG: DUF4198 domain-containing protein [Burkholderiaceae bacterium]|jgi:hypothetical protein|nr:DUF4198 domain-containing protein [Burkholderiaceae bacterium]